MVSIITRASKSSPLTWPEMDANLNNLKAAVEGAATGIRSTVSYTTASLAAGSSEQGSITVPKAYSILKLATDYPARVRIYLSTAHQTADLARSVSTDPTGDHGCILEVVTTAGVLALNLSPAAVGASPTDGTTAYITLQNLDSVSRAVTATLSLLSMEP